MTDSESDSTADSPDGDGTVDCDPDRLELETLTRDEPWGPEAFRDAGDATFRTR